MNAPVRTHDQIAERARALMCAHVERPLTIPELARACGTSPTVLKESFREEYGMPVYAWFRRWRMLRAARLLVRTDLTVAEVARTVGYANPSKFTQAFSACLKMTPSAWRERYGR